MTETAAKELQARKFPEHTLVPLASSEETDFHVTVLYRRTRQLRHLSPVSAVDVPRSTRDMPVVQYRVDNFAVRFILCHWTAFGDRSAEYRGRLAEAIRRISDESSVSSLFD